MVHYGKFIHTRTGRIIMSVLLGFGLASLFRSVCKGKNCIEFQGPPSDFMDKDKIYSFDGKCYTYSKTMTKCNKSKRIVGLPNAENV
jgi:hypothetical protein